MCPINTSQILLKFYVGDFTNLHFIMPVFK
jgi:hypothetical protein